MERRVVWLGVVLLSGAACARGSCGSQAPTETTPLSAHAAPPPFASAAPPPSAVARVSQADAGGVIVQSEGLPPGALSSVSGRLEIRGSETLAVSPDGSRLAVAADGAAQIIDIGPKSVKRIARAGSRASALAFSPDGRLAVGFVPLDNLAPALESTSVGFYDPKTGLETGRLKAESKLQAVRASSLVFARDGSLLIAGSCLCAFDGSGARIRELSGGEHVRRATLSGDGKRIAGLVEPPVGHTVEPDGTHRYTPTLPALRIWRSGDARAWKELSEGAPSAVELSPDGARLYVASRSSPGLVAQLIEAGARVTLYANPVSALAVSPDARRVAIAGTDRVIRVLALPSGRVEQSFRGHVTEVAALRFAGDSRRLVSASTDRILVWSL